MNTLVNSLVNTLVDALVNYLVNALWDTLAPYAVHRGTSLLRTLGPGRYELIEKKSNK